MANPIKPVVAASSAGHSIHAPYRATSPGQVTRPRQFLGELLKHQGDKGAVLVGTLQPNSPHRVAHRVNDLEIVHRSACLNALVAGVPLFSGRFHGRASRLARADLVQIGRPDEVLRSVFGGGEPAGTNESQDARPADAQRRGGFQGGDKSWYELTISGLEWFGRYPSKALW